MGTENAVNSKAFAENFAFDGRSAPSAPFSRPEDPDTNCCTCGHDRKPFHRLKRDGTARRFCSSCVLFLYKGMHCCLCFRVYETPASKGPSSLWISCAKCHRIAHEKCARERELLVDSLNFACSKCHHFEQISTQISRVSTEGDGSPPLKRLRSSLDEVAQCNPSVDDRQDIHRGPKAVLAAAQIIAMLAVQHAKDAKARARASAAAAARAAACAKLALDTAYRILRQEAGLKLDPTRHLSGVLPGNNVGLPAAIKAPRNLTIDGKACIHDPLSYSNALSSKDQTSKGGSTSSYIPVNARMAARYGKINILPLSANVTDDLCRNRAFEKRQKIPVQETSACLQNVGTGIETEVANISASPASILDAAASLDIPRPSSLVGPGPGQCSEVAAASDARLSCTGENARDQLSSGDKNIKKFNDSVKEEVLRCMTGGKSMDCNPNC